MATALIDEARITHLNEAAPAAGAYVLYWMQASVRTRDNHALEYAVRAANELDLPLVVGFGLDRDYSDAGPRSLRFVVDGLIDVASALERRNIGFVVRAGHPGSLARELAAAAAAVVVDRAYLREPRRWRRELAEAISVPVVEVEANVVVPVEVASDHREWAARTLRPKVHEHLDRFAEELSTTAIRRRDPPALDSLDVTDRAALLRAAGVAPAAERRFEGGEHQAHAALARFVGEALGRYEQAGTDVLGSASSHLSIYLHYGQISPAEILRRVRAADMPRGAVEQFAEELVVRRELAHNYVWFESDYDRYRALPDWARATLDEHRDDERDVVYTAGELEGAETHDPYWNAAMIEMRETGYLHNRMRMYWAKRIIEWTNTPEYAFRVALDLNNRHFLDGRDPSSYANVAWAFGLHDQAFGERPVIGKVRPMTYAGLERKIDGSAYLAHVENLTGVSPTDPAD